MRWTTESVRESKLNAAAGAQLTFQMLTLLQKYITPEPVFKYMGQQMSGPDNASG